MSGGRPEVLVAGDGAWFALGGGARVELLGRRVLRRLLCALAEVAGDERHAVTSEGLIEQGWPNERIDEASARNRLYFAISELRKLGLREVLVHDAGGYRLKGDVLVSSDGIADGSVFRAPIDRLFGREPALATLERWLSGGTRLVTVVGPGGVGKTRLALEAARRLLPRCPGGVWVCDLTEARSDDDVFAVVGDALGVSLPDLPAARLGRALTLRSDGLLVLDNAEGVASILGAVLADWVAAAPSLSVIITSRVPLGVGGEHRLQLSPLETRDAAALFYDRAAQVGPARFSDHDVQQLVTALEGLPLAIELAAARSHVLPPARMLERLPQRLALLEAGRVDAPTRHRSLAVALRASWELASPSAQRAWARCSVFRGGFTEEAAAAVLEHDATGTGTLSVLQELVDHNVLGVDIEVAPVRFRFLETMREFGRDALTAEQSERTVVGLHLRFFEAWGTSEELSELFASERSRLGQIRAQDIDNLLSACDAGAALGAFDAAARCLTAAYHVFYGRVGPVEPFLVRAHRLVAESDLDRTVRLRLRLALGAALNRSGDLGRAAEQLTAVRAEVGVGDDAHLGRALQHLATTRHRQGRRDLARALDEEAVEVFRQAGLVDLQAVAMAAVSGGWLAEDCERAREWIDQASALLERLDGARHQIARQVVLEIRAKLYEALGQVDRAIETVETLLPELQRSGCSRTEARVRMLRGTMLQDVGRLDEARRAYQEVIAIHREIQIPSTYTCALLNLGLLMVEVGELEDAERTLREALRSAERCSVRLGGVALGNLAHALSRLGRTEEATAAFDRAEAVLVSAGVADDRIQLLCQRGAHEQRLGQHAEAEAVLARASSALEASGSRPGSGIANQVAALRERLGLPRTG